MKLTIITVGKLKEKYWIAAVKAYEATSLLVQFEYNDSLNTMLEVILVAGGVAVGLLFADQLSKMFIHKKRKTKPEYITSSEVER